MKNQNIKAIDKIVNSDVLTKQEYLNFEYFKNSSNSTPEEVNDTRKIKIDLLNATKVVSNETKYDKTYVNLEVAQTGYRNDIKSLDLDLGDLAILAKTFNEILDDTGYVLPDDHYKVVIEADNFSLTYDELIIYNTAMFVAKSNLNVYYEFINKPIDGYIINDTSLENAKQEAIDNNAIDDREIEVNVMYTTQEGRETMNTVKVTIIGQDAPMVLPEL